MPPLPSNPIPTKGSMPVVHLQIEAINKRLSETRGMCGSGRLKIDQDAP